MSDIDNQNSELGDIYPEYLAPTKPVERALAGIWSSILGVSPIGVNDDFFELGGDSLDVMLILSQVQDVFQVNIPVPMLLKCRTIADMAELIDQLRLKQTFD